MFSSHLSPSKLRREHIPRERIGYWKAILSAFLSVYVCECDPSSSYWAVRVCSLWRSDDRHTCLHTKASTKAPGGIQRHCLTRRLAKSGCFSFCAPLKKKRLLCVVPSEKWFFSSRGSHPAAFSQSHAQPLMMKVKLALCHYLSTPAAFLVCVRRLQ